MTITRMAITRVWAMPNKWTFEIQPIRELIEKYVGDGKKWLDPFSGMSTFAEFTNDMNPDMPSKFHLDAKEFLKSLDGDFKGVLFDPPYSLRQIKECYDGLDKEVSYESTLDASFSELKDLIVPKIMRGGCAISCGWNTNGFGINRNFEIIEILLVPHGGHHNDTIVTIERKLLGRLDQYNVEHFPS